FEAAFQCPLIFAAGRNRIFYRNEDLDRPLASANREIAIQNDEVVQRYLSRLLKQSLAKQVTEKMIALLAMGDPNQDIIADQLHISSRHLQRKHFFPTTTGKR
ncbi:MAG: AraC-like DNA-binding protein, partial [Oceanicoccus sp.]